MYRDFYRTTTGSSMDVRKRGKKMYHKVIMGCHRSGQL